MRLLRYSFTTVYGKGSDLKDADALCRNPTTYPTLLDQLAKQEINQHIGQIISLMPATETRLKEIVSHTFTDKGLSTN